MVKNNDGLVSQSDSVWANFIQFLNWRTVLFFYSNIFLAGAAQGSSKLKIILKSNPRILRFKYHIFSHSLYIFLPKSAPQNWGRGVKCESSFLCWKRIIPGDTVHAMELSTWLVLVSAHQTEWLESCVNPYSCNYWLSMVAYAQSNI